MIQRLIVNGCSYMKYYDDGGGTQHLASLLNIPTYKSFAINGAANNRIIRTTLRDIYSTNISTLYIIGTAFVNRFEMPVYHSRGDDGRWESTNGLPLRSLPDSYAQHLRIEDINSYVKGYVNIMSGVDLCEDLMYRLLSMIDAARFNGHRMLVFNTAEHSVDYYLDEPQFEPFRQYKEVIGGYDWRSITWQFEQGVNYAPGDEKFPAECRHVALGEHYHLNEFLTNYIKEHKILE